MSAPHLHNHSSPSLFCRSSNVETTDAALLESQLLSELAQAADAAMVPIPVHNRSFPQVPNAVEVKALNQPTSSKRRKLEDGENTVYTGTNIQRQKATVENSESHKEEYSLAPPGVLETTSYGNRRLEDTANSVSILSKKTHMVSSKHRRFGSEEANIDRKLDSFSPVMSEGEQEAEDEDEEEEEEDDDENDGPEAITAAAGFEASRSAILDAARTAKRQKSTLRAQRRDKDVRLKAQAQEARSRKHSKTISESAASSSDDRETHALERKVLPNNPMKKSLPALLPEELLALEPVIQPPQVLTPNKTRIFSKKIKLSDKEQNGPKDLKRGNKVIRVMQVQQSALPPKSSSASKSIREKWLLGQRSFSDSSTVFRPRSTAGFIRK